MDIPDPEWKFIQAFCNRILCEGMKREAEEIEEARDRSRKYRLWLKHRCRKSWESKLTEI